MGRKPARCGQLIAAKYQRVRIPEMAPDPPALVALAARRTVRKRRNHAAQQAIGLNVAFGNTSDDRLRKEQA
jgi:hypothetical protein